LLSEASREKLTQLAKQASAATGGAVPPDPKRMIVSGDANAKSIREVKLVSQTGNSAVISLDDGSGPKEVKMVRESFRWKVSLD